MGTYLLSSILAALISLVQSVPSPTDTTTRFIVNGEEIKDFSGTILVGKEIASYSIETDYDEKEDKVTNIHVIETKDGGTKTLYFVENKKGAPQGYTKEEFEKIKPTIQDKIKSIKICHGVIKPDPDGPVTAGNIKNLKTDPNSTLIYVYLK